MLIAEEKRQETDRCLESIEDEISELRSDLYVYLLQTEELRL